jgi:double-stranded uracil-DNA glycosylase
MAKRAKRTPVTAESAAASAERKRSFPPVIDQRTRLLVLGSLPGEESLRQARYYANPRNHFWRLMGAVIGRELGALPYEARLDALLAAGVGLWDVVASASRRGSLDTAIRGHEPNLLADLVAAQPGLAAIGFNGAKSAAIGRKALGPTGLALIDLPSSSPAYTLPFEAKRETWLQLRRFL